MLMQFNGMNQGNNGFFYNERLEASRRRNRIIFIVLVFVLTNVLSIFIGNRIAITTGSMVTVSKKEYEDLKDFKAALKEDENKELNATLSKYDGVLKFKKLFEVKKMLENYYYGDINEDILVEGAIKGLTESLKDPYTVFMNKKEFEEFNTSTEGEYVGVGLMVGAKEEKIVVISVFEKSPADKAGIKSGDVITRVNDTDVSGKDLEKAVSMMRGKEGEAVQITLFREGQGNIEAKVTRAKIAIQTVKYEMLDNNIGYIQLSSFDLKTDEDFIKAAEELKAKGMKGLILDLRDNPGGLLDTCVNISSQFIDKDKVIVTQKYKDGSSDTSKAVKGQLLKGMPLVVLTNDYSASASEILAGVIRDYEVGTLVGTKTFGKGVVQTVLRTGGGTALKVTISKYYTPSGENIDKIGIKPDVEVEYPQELLAKEYDRATDPQFQKALEVIKGKIK